MSFRTYDTLDELARAAADYIASCAQAAINAAGRFSIALSGGNTPRHTYELLAGAPYHDSIDWSKFHVFWGDERCAPPDDPRSNYRMAHEAWLRHVPLPAENIHRMRGEDNPESAAHAYARDLQTYCSLPHVDAAPAPQLDLVLLGIGEDAHTASLFPHTAPLTEQQRWVVTNASPEHELTRLTFTPRVINAARQVLFLVAGQSKAQALAKILQGPQLPEQLPAQLVQPASGKLDWLVESVVARDLDTAKLKEQP